MGISLGTSFKPLAEQSTTVPSQEQPSGQALSIMHSPANLVRNSSEPGNETQNKARKADQILLNSIFYGSIAKYATQI